MIHLYASLAPPESDEVCLAVVLTPVPGPSKEAPWDLVIHQGPGSYRVKGGVSAPQLGGLLHAVERIRAELSLQGWEAEIHIGRWP